MSVLKNSVFLCVFIYSTIANYMLYIFCVQFITFKSCYKISGAICFYSILSRGKLRTKC